MRTIDEFSRVVGGMGVFSEMIACGCKNVALGYPTADRALRDEHMIFAKKICEEDGIQCCEENAAFITDLFPATMNKGKFNILFYKDERWRDEYFAQLERKNQLVAEGRYTPEMRRKVAYDYGHLLSYSDEAIERMLAKNTDLEEF